MGDQSHSDGQLVQRIQRAFAHEEPTTELSTILEQADPLRSEGAEKAGPARTAASAKIVIAGGFGVGKTTFINAVSEIIPLTTEAETTSGDTAVDDTSQVQGKTTTTAVMDFGRVTLDTDLILYLFGTPSQSRFWFMWDELARDADGAIVLVDLRRVDDCFPAIDYFEDRRLPFVVAANAFPGTDVFPDRAVRDALALPEDCPLVRMDARQQESCMDTLVLLVEHAALSRGSAPLPEVQPHGVSATNSA